jgi:hypothetical protein
MIAFPQDNPIAPSGRFSRSWQRFLLDLRNRIGDSTPYIPVVSSKSGVLNSASATSSYQKIGEQVCWSVSVVISDNGTGSNAIDITLPITTYGIVIGCGVNTNTGKMVVCRDSFPRSSVDPRATSISVYSYDGTYPIVGASGGLRLHLVYEITNTVA